MLGHYDAVWLLGTLEQMPFVVEEDRVRGPGVYDMKGGVAQALLALDALAHFGCEPPVVTHVFLNSDEEIGSGESAGVIRRLSRICDRVFVAEDKRVAVDTAIGKFVAPFERIMGFSLLGVGTTTRFSGRVLRGGGNPNSSF